MIFVVAGPPASTAVNSPGVRDLGQAAYYRAMYAYQNGVIRNYFDIQAVHPGGSANPPDTLWPGNPEQRLRAGPPTRLSTSICREHTRADGAVWSGVITVLS